MSGQVWEVFGGVDRGGIIVRAERAVTSSLAPQRLSTGALVQELDLHENRLQFMRLTGTGPDTGWVSIRLKDKELVAKTNRMPPLPTESESMNGSGVRKLPPSPTSLENVDTKLSGTIDLAVLDAPAGYQTTERAKTQGRLAYDVLDAQKGENGMVATAVAIKGAIPECIASLLQQNDLKSVTPKTVMTELARRLRLAPDELRPHGLMIKQLAAEEVKRVVAVGMDLPLQVTLVRFSVPLASKARREIVEPMLEVGSPEALAAEHVANECYAQAVSILSETLNELEATNKCSSKEVKADRAALLVRRGHARWKDLRYVWAHDDFAKAEQLAPGGLASPSLLALRYCMGMDLELESVPGHVELKALIRDAVALHRAGNDAVAQRRHLFHPRQAEPRVDCNDKPAWAIDGMQIFDGSCHIGEYDGYPAARIGYRMLVNRTTPPEDTPLLVYYHGNGEICTEYTFYAGLYQKFPVTLMVFDYRAYGWSTGEPQMGCLTKDPVMCMRKLPELLEMHKLPWPWPAPLILMGRSLGSAVAGRLIGHFPDMFDGLIIDSGTANDKEQHYSDMLAWSGPHKEETESAFSAMRELVQESLPVGCEIGQSLIAPLGTCDSIRGYRGLVLVIHGVNDFIVPPVNGKRNYDAATHSYGRALVELPADHNNLAGVPEFWKRQQEFVQKVIQRRKDELRHVSA